MEEITIGQIATLIAFIVAFISGLEFISNRINKTFKKILNESLEPLKKDIRQQDEASCKNFLVRFLKDVELGNKLGHEEIKRGIETYNHYTQYLNGNSYIHTKWDILMPKIQELLKEK